MNMILRLLFEIAKCKIFSNPTHTVNENHPCNGIVNFQREQGAKAVEDFQIPEPWSGDILNAPILIISSNPAYSKNELFPDLLWPEPMIADFFINRFKDRGKEYSWVFQNKVLNKDGTRGRSVRYWAHIRNRVKELLGYEPKPGIDYCLTELVHCKSSGQIGVERALRMCTEKFFKSIINISSAKIIIAIGSFVRDCNYFNGNQNINGIPVIYLPHPNARMPRRLPAHYSKKEIEEFRDLLENNDNRKRKIDYRDIDLPTEEKVKKFIDEKIQRTQDGKCCI